MPRNTHKAIEQVVYVGMNAQVQQKLRQLPSTPGVYFHKNKDDLIIYVGKAAVLKNRVRQYFHKSRAFDAKTEALISEIADIDWIEVADEVEALFLEAELIRRYKPQYNILLRDDKSVAYVRVNHKSSAPTVTITRRPLDDGAEYYGPFLQTAPVKKSLQYLRKIFPYSTHTSIPARACLQYHLGLCPGPEIENYNEMTYKANLRKLVLYLRGSRVQVLQELEKEMQVAAQERRYEDAAKKRNALLALKSLRTRIIFSDKENLDLSKDHALHDLTMLFGLLKAPRRIEGYDISHMQGTDTVASMVVFTNGIADKPMYRKFKMRAPGNDDFAHMYEVISRRFRSTNTQKWPTPGLVIIDGGKGQLGAAIRARNELELRVPMLGLAKKFEEIIIHKAHSNVTINTTVCKRIGGYIREETDEYIRIELPQSSHIIKLLQRIRDESHRFAVSYHTVLKRNRQTTSLLDDIPGIGPITRKKLLRNFGSVKAIQAAQYEELRRTVGVQKATVIQSYFSNFTNHS